VVDSPQRRRERVRAQGVLMVEQGGRGGVADYTGCLVAALARRGVPVALATAEDHLYGQVPGVSIQPIFGYVRGHSHLARTVRNLHLGWAVNGLRFLGALPALLRLARGRAVVHLQGWEVNSLGLLATLALRAVGARIVFTSHNTFERQRFAIDGGRVLGALSRATIVHTAADVPRARGTVRRIPHGHYGSLADTAAVVDPAQARASLGLSPDAPVALLFGVLRPDKGVRDLLEAAARVPGWQVLIAGEDHGALAEVGRQLALPALAGRVVVREGFAPVADVGRFFAAADLVALPYRRASQSGVLHLAYGFNRPVVIYPVGGLTEAVQAGRTGWVCSSATPSALAQALVEAAALGRDGLASQGRTAGEWARETFGWDEIAAATEEVYEEVLSGLVTGVSAR
jgi:glycosyltransferase involved in cell wall biosynthesis